MIVLYGSYFSVIRCWISFVLNYVSVFSFKYWYVDIFVFEIINIGEFKVSWFLSIEFIVGNVIKVNKCVISCDIGDFIVWVCIKI